MNVRQMPKKGDLFCGEIINLRHTKPDLTGWWPRDIQFYKKELRNKQRYNYPSANDNIVLIDIDNCKYGCSFTKPDHNKYVCLGKPENLKSWYVKEGYSKEHINQLKRNGCRDKVYFKYTGEDNKFFIYTEKEFKNNHSSVPIPSHTALMQ
jgi:hypothetical protein